MSVHVVTIVVEDDGPPRVDLGGLSPYAVLSILESISNTLADFIEIPTIVSNGELFTSWNDIEFLEELDDED
jgi:hypothetical protein